MLGSAQTRQADNNVLARHKRKTSGPSIAIAIVFFSFEVTRNSFDILNGLQYFWRYMHKVMQPRWVYGSDTHATNRFHHYQVELSYCSCCLHRFAGVICILPNVLTRKLCLLWRNVCQRSHWTPPSKEKRSFPGYWQAGWFDSRACRPAMYVLRRIWFWGGFSTMTSSTSCLFPQKTETFLLFRSLSRVFELSYKPLLYCICFGTRQSTYWFVSFVPSASAIKKLRVPMHHCSSPNSCRHVFFAESSWFFKSRHLLQSRPMRAVTSYFPFPRPQLEFLESNCAFLHDIGVLSYQRTTWVNSHPTETTWNSQNTRPWMRFFASEDQEVNEIRQRKSQSSMSFQRIPPLGTTRPLPWQV